MKGGAIESDMPKAKKKKPTTQEDQVDLAVIELGVKEEYQQYLKEHNRKLRQLERELSGANMIGPE